MVDPAKVTKTQLEPQLPIAISDNKDKLSIDL
jgi:hypothetical protein